MFCIGFFVCGLLIRKVWHLPVKYHPPTYHSSKPLTNPSDSPVDFKTDYRNPKKPHLCNGFTLGTHDKSWPSTKNILLPYGSCSGHFCLGSIYNRIEGLTIEPWLRNTPIMLRLFYFRATNINKVR